MHFTFGGQFDQVNISRGRFDYGVIFKVADLTKILSLGGRLDTGRFGKGLNCLSFT